MDDRAALLGQLRIDRTEVARNGGRGWLFAGGALLLVAAAGVLAWYVFDASDRVVARAAVAEPITIEGPASRGSILDASGYVVARRQATVSAKITGRVVEVLIEEGQRVEATRSSRASTTRTRARPSPRPKRKSRKPPPVSRRRAWRSRTRCRSSSAIAAVLGKFTSAQEFDTAKASYDVARSAHSVAEQALGVAAAVRASRSAISRTPSCARRSRGVVTVKAAQEGEMVSPNSAGGGFTRTGIGTIVDMDSLEIEVDVSENFINRVKPSRASRSSSTPIRTGAFRATSIAIVPTADRAKATVRVRVAFDERDARVLPEMGVRVAFLTSRRRGASGSCGRTGRPCVVPVGRGPSQRRYGHRVRRAQRHGRAARRARRRIRGATGRIVLSGIIAGTQLAIGDLAAFWPTARASEWWNTGRQPMAAIVSIKNVVKHYIRGKQRVEVLHGLDLEVDAGEFLALMGPSGSGKTTLLNLIGGLDRAGQGEVTVVGERLDQLSAGSSRNGARATSASSSSSTTCCRCSRAERNVEVPLLLTKLSRKERQAQRRRGADARRARRPRHHKPAELSGGQQQRVAIARAIVTDPTLLVCDEPTGDLDRETSESILGLLQLLNRKHGKTIIMVTHDPRAAELASRRLYVDKGRLEHLEKIAASAA